MPRSRVYQGKSGGKRGGSCACCDGGRTTTVEEAERKEGYREGQVVIAHCLVRHSIMQFRSDHHPLSNDVLSDTGS